MRYLPGNPSENELTADHKLGVAAAGLDALSNFKKTVVVDRRATGTSISKEVSSRNYQMFTRLEHKDCWLLPIGPARR
jgi:hypothetical protein